MSRSHAAGWPTEEPTAAQLKKFFAQVESGRITRVRLQAFLNKSVAFPRGLVEEWLSFYRRFFHDLGPDFSDLASVNVPDDPGGFDRVLIVAQGLTSNAVFDTCNGRFPAWRYTDNLDNDVRKNDRIPTRTYAIRVGDCQEPDEKYRDMSLDDLKGECVKGITLLERLVYELKYFDETGDHLDVTTTTLCSGSRCAEDEVPEVYWNDGELVVNWHISSASPKHACVAKVVTA